MRLALVLFALAACTPTQPVFDGGTGPVNESPEPPRHTPRWAFAPWISKDISDAADHRAFVQGFIDRDIPVGVGVLDSPWETNYNTFVPNPTRYPEFASMVTDLKAKGVRTVLWITGMVNDTSFDAEPGGDVYMGASPNLAAGRRGGYFVDQGKTWLWWKGQGAGLDFFNPAALAWWHRQQDQVLDLGVAGFKLDFADEYAEGDGFDTFAGRKSRTEYREAYYRDYLAYGVAHRGRDEFTTMSRPYDISYGFDGHFFARKEHCPIGWVGDNRRDWVGIVDAMDEMLRSAEAGYVVLGSDIGGYLDVDDHDLTGPKIPFSEDVFARWTALGALTPFMQLHGRGNFAPWTVPANPDATVARYRYWAKLHTQLVPFFYSLAEEAYAGGPTIMRPQGALADHWKSYEFQLGDAFLVAPIIDATGRRDVELPSGATWYDWWDQSSHPGGTTLASYDATSLDRIPLFLREGAIVPMEDEVLWVPSQAASHFTLHEVDDSLTALDASGDTLTLARVTKATTVRVLVTAPTRVEVNGAMTAFTVDQGFVRVPVAASTAAVHVHVVR